jgi:hypothetical protein
LPLIKSKSPAAFRLNLKSELAAGRPKSQALAIAYSTARRSKADGGGISSPYDAMSLIARSNPYLSMLKGQLEGVYKGFDAGRSGKEGLEGYATALENQYVPEGAVKYDDADQYYDKDNKPLATQYRPNIIPATKTEKGKGWLGSDWEGAMPALIDVNNTVGNPFAATKGVTLGSGPVFRANKSLANKWEGEVGEELFNRLSPTQMTETEAQRRALAEKYLSMRTEPSEYVPPEPQHPYFPIDLPFQTKVQSEVAAARAAEPKRSDPFYSALEQAVQDAKIKVGSPQQWMGTLSNNPGIKPSEIEWSGLKEWLDAKGGKVTKEEIADYVKKQTPEVQQIERSADDARVEEGEWGSDRERERAEEEARERAYEGFQNDWRAQNEFEREYIEGLKRNNPELDADEIEDLLQKDRDNYTYYDALSEVENQWIDDHWDDYRPEPPKNEVEGTQWHDYTLPGGDNYREVLLTLPKNKQQSGGRNFKHSHFENDKDFVAHMRIDDRNIGGKKTLFANEAQSDWHQQGASTGYRTPQKERAFQEADRRTQDALFNRNRAKEALIKDMTEGRASNLQEIRDSIGQYGGASDFLKKWGGYGKFIDDLDRRTAGLPEQLEYERLAAEGRKASAAQGHVPDAPFKKEWPDLVLKSMIRKAAEEGYPQIAWPGSPETVSRVEGWGAIQKDGDKYFSNGRNMTSIINRYVQDMPRIADKLVKKQGVRVRKVVEGGYSPEKHSLVQRAPGTYEFKDKESRNFIGPTFNSAEEAMAWVKDHSNDFGQTFNVLEINPQLKKHALEKGFSLFAQGKTPMPRSPYDREDRKNRAYGGRVNKQGGGSLSGGGGSGWGGEGGYDSGIGGLLQKYFADRQSGLTDRYSDDLKLSMPGDRKMGPNDAEVMGLSLPQGGGNAAWDNNRASGFMGPLKKGANRNREDRAGGLASLEDVIGPDRAVYPPNSPYSKFQGSVGDPTLEMVGTPKKAFLHKDDEQPPERLSMLSGKPMLAANNEDFGHNWQVPMLPREKLAPADQRFDRKFAPEDTSRFNRKRTNEDPENITRDSVYNPDKSNAYWQDLPAKETARDVVKSYGTGFANGIPDVIGLPRTIASIGGPAVPDMFLNSLPKSEDWKRRIDTALYGKDGEAYTPKTGYGRFANSAGEISPYITAATGLAATRGGLAAPAVAGGLSGVLGAAMKHGKEAFRNNAPLAYNPMYSNAFASGGSIPMGVPGTTQPKAGLVGDATGGRADKVPGSVKAGSYVMPADVVSAMGQGNTLAGAKSLSRLIGKSPFDGGGRPPKGKRMGMKHVGHFADGGSADQDVDVNVSGGEYVVPPEAVAELGGGDIDYGHEILDALAMEVRRKNISHLSKLPPPRKD